MFSDIIENSIEFFLPTKEEIENIIFKLENNKLLNSYDHLIISKVIFLNELNEMKGVRI